MRGDFPNVLSFDLEHWHSATLLADAVEDPDDHIEESTRIVLDLLDRHDVRATFFTVGEVAVEHPNLVGEIAATGHEVASHGHTHTPLFELSPAAFERELDRAAVAIERATGTRPDGFRAPNFSVNRGTAWAISVLETTGYRYDSSVFPIKTPMYGVTDAPIRPYVASVDDPFAVRSKQRDGLLELPISVAGSRLRVPIAGGFYARLLPIRILEVAIRRLRRRGVPASLYFHPWELNPEVPIESPSLSRRFVSFHGIERLSSKLDHLLEAFEWAPAGEVVDRLERSDRPVASR